MKDAPTGIGVDTSTDDAVLIRGGTRLTQIEVLRIKQLPGGLEARGALCGCNLSSAPAKVEQNEQHAEHSQCTTDNASHNF